MYPSVTPLCDVGAGDSSMMPVSVFPRFELDRPDRNYTVETLTHFPESGVTAELFFLMGADSGGPEIQTWKEWERLLLMANHIVVTPYLMSWNWAGMVVLERIVDTRGEGAQYQEGILIPAGSFLRMQCTGDFRDGDSTRGETK